MIKEVKNFKRKELFDHYHACDNPFLIISTKIDVTNVVNYCKKYKHFYPTLGFLVTKTANQLDAFKYRYKNSKFYYCEEIKSNYTQMFDDENIGFFSIPAINDFDEYIKQFLKTQEQFLKEKRSLNEDNLNDIWISCAPWFSFTNLVPPFNKEVTIPQFIWDKYESVNERYYVNLMIMVHHGFADGYHIGQFVS